MQMTGMVCGISEVILKNDAQPLVKVNKTLSPWFTL